MPGCSVQPAKSFQRGQNLLQGSHWRLQHRCWEALQEVMAWRWPVSALDPAEVGRGWPVPLQDRNHANVEALLLHPEAFL